MDKAGAYAIQGLASKFVRRIEGSYTNVVGLPVELVHQYLRRWDHSLVLCHNDTSKLAWPPHSKPANPPDFSASLDSPAPLLWWFPTWWESVFSPPPDSWPETWVMPSSSCSAGL